MSKRMLKMCILCTIIIVFVLLNTYINYVRKDDRNTVSSENEFLRTVDCAELFDRHQGYSFLLSFEACAEKEGDLLVYMQNGVTSKYKFSEQYIHVSTEMKCYEMEITPYLSDENTDQAFLAFYGEYGSGVIPKVRNITIDPIVNNAS